MVVNRIFLLFVVILSLVVVPSIVIALEVDADSLLEDGHVMGDADAPIILVKYSSFTDPFSNRHNLVVAPEINKNFIETGEVLFVYKHFVRNDRDVILAGAADCAGKQNHFFEYADAVFEKTYNDFRREFTTEQLVNLAELVGLDTVAFEECFEQKPQPKEASEYRQLPSFNREQAKNFGITGTPSFIIGSEEKGFMLITGAEPYNKFKEAIEELTRKPTCENGCFLEDACVPYGYRLEINNTPAFCSLNKSFENQKEDGISCQNDHECKTNQCSDLCVDIKAELEETRNLLQRILSWFGLA